MMKNRLSTFKAKLKFYFSKVRNYKHIKPVALGISLLVIVSVASFLLISDSISNGNEVSKEPSSYPASYIMPSYPVSFVQADKPTEPIHEYVWPKEYVDTSNWAEYQYTTDKRFITGTYIYKFRAPLGINREEKNYSVNAFNNDMYFTISNIYESFGAGEISSIKTYEIIGNIGQFSNVTRIDYNLPYRPSGFESFSAFEYSSGVEFTKDCGVNYYLGNQKVLPPCSRTPGILSPISSTPGIRFSCYAKNPTICDEILKTVSSKYFPPASYPNSYPASYVYQE